MMPEKNSGLNAMRTHDLCNTGANWELVTLFARWLNGKCARRWSERSGFEPWPVKLCCVLGKTLNSHSASLHSGVQLGTGEINAGGNPAMD